MDTFQIMSWLVGPAILLCFILDVFALSRGFEFFEEKKNLKMWPCTLVLIVSAILFAVGIFNEEMRTILWWITGVLQAFVLIVDVLKIKLWGILAYFVQFIVSAMFPFTLFLLISTFNISPKKSR